MLKPFDKDGQQIFIGDYVVFNEKPVELLEGLPDEDQARIKSKVGVKMQVIDFDKYGYAEIEFKNEHNGFTTIWLKPNLLNKVQAHE